MASSTFRFFAVAIMACGAMACSNDMDTVRLFDRANQPDQEIAEARIRRSQQGLLQMELDAPQVMQYHEPTPKTVYPRGVEVRFFNGAQQMTTKLSAGYAFSLDEKKVMKAQDSVVVIDYGNGDTVYLQELIWNQNEDRIYSNHAVRAVNGSRVTYGDGFTSDGKMQNMRILRQRGTIEFQE